MKKKTVNIGILGFGTVGSGTYQVLKSNAALIERQTGISIRVKKAADIVRKNLPASVFTKKTADIIKDPAISIVVETIGGVNPARQYILAALKAGKDVVTSNKEVLAKHGEELYRVAEKHRAKILCEGSVGGGIPILRPLRRALAGEKIEEIYGIVNGTTNYILSKMADAGNDFKEVLAEAQQKGYAEANSASDIEGLDAKYKIQILASSAYRARVNLNDIYVEGITKITKEDIRYAKELGHTIKLIALAKTVNGELDVRVHPLMIPNDHPLAKVSGPFNAIYIKGSTVGNLMFYGQGAGALPTGSAVVSDIIELAQGKVGSEQRRTAKIAHPAWQKIKMRRIDDTVSKYYLRMKTADKPGVLAGIASIFGRNRASIKSVLQTENVGSKAQIVIVLHEVKEKNFRKALAAIKKLPTVSEVSSVIRVGL